MNNYKQLPDKLILEAAYMAKELGEEENNFLKLIEIAEAFSPKFFSTYVEPERKRKANRAAGQGSDT